MIRSIHPSLLCSPAAPPSLLGATSMSWHCMATRANANPFFSSLRDSTRDTRWPCCGGVRPRTGRASSCSFCPEWGMQCRVHYITWWFSMCRVSQGSGPVPPDLSSLRVRGGTRGDHVIVSPWSADVGSWMRSGFVQEGTRAIIRSDAKRRCRGSYM